MNFNLPTLQIDLQKYTEIISIGNTKTSKLLIDRLQLPSSTYPFDDITTQPHFIIKYIHDNTQFFPIENEIKNNDNVIFENIDLSTSAKRSVFEAEMKHCFAKFAELFSKETKVLLLYTTEADLYNQHDSLINKTINYINIKHLAMYLKQLYPKSDFDILCIHVNDERPHETLQGNEKDTHIFNFTMYIENSYISLNQETKKRDVIEPFQKLVEAFLKCLFYGSKTVVDELKKTEETNQQNIDITNTSDI